MKSAAIFLAIGIFFSAGYSQSVIDKYNEACSLNNRRLFAEAESLLKEIIKEYPDFYRAYSKLATVYSDQNRAADGLRYFDSLISNSREKALAVYGKTGLLQNESNYSQAIDLLTETIRKDCVQSVLYRTLGSFYAQANRVDEGISFFKDLPDGDCGKANQHFGLGEIYYQDENETLARPLFEKTVSIDSSISYAYRRLGRIDRVTNPIQSKRNYDKWRKNIDNVQEDLQEYYYQIGLHYFIIGKQENARNSFRKSLAIAESAFDSTHAQLNYFYLAEINLRLGKPKIAKYFYQKIINAHTINPRPYLAALAALGSSYSASGDFTRAIGLYLLAIRTAEEFESTDLKFNALHNMAYMHLVLGNLDEASTYFKQCEQYYLDSQREYELIDLFNNIGIVNTEKEKYEEALQYFQKALKIAQKIDRLEGIVNFLFSISEAQIRLGNYEEANMTLNKAANLAPTHGTDRDLTEIERLRGLLYEESGNFEKALEFYKRAYREESDSKRPYLLVPIIEGLARVSSKMHNDEVALIWLKEAIDVIDTVGTEIPVEDLRRTFLSSRISIFDRMVNTQLRLNTTEAMHEAFKYTEKAKAQSLQNLLKQASAIAQMNIPDSLAFQLGEIQSLIEEKHGKIQDFKLAKTVQKDLIMRLDEEILGLELKSESLKKQLEQLSPQRDSVSPTYITVDSLQKNLNNKQVVLEYKVTQDRLIMFLVKQKEFIVKTQPISRDSLKVLVSDIIQKIQDKLVTVYDLNNVYQLLVEPFEKYISARDELIIVPDSFLSYLPFESLITALSKVEFKRDFKNSRFLIEEYPITYSASAALIDIVVPRQNNPSSNFLGVAVSTFSDSLLGPLPWTEKEVRDIENAISDPNNVLLLHEDATKSEYKKNIGLFKVEHIASHILVDDNQPMYSKIMLSDDNSQTSNDLHAYEAINLQTNADMVVLSGCESALGKLFPGEGIVGMSQAFITAGAQSLVMSLWPVDDRLTSEFMVEFYQNLQSGLSKHKALQQAKISMINDIDDDPLYWAPFVLSGQTEAIDFNTRIAWWYWVLGLAILIVLAYLIQRYKKKHSFLKQFSS